MCILYDVMVNLQVVDTEVTVEADGDESLPHTEIVNAFTKGKIEDILLHFWSKS